jgi:hypothetical protein
MYSASREHTQMRLISRVAICGCLIVFSAGCNATSAPRSQIVEPGPAAEPNATKAAIYVAASPLTVSTQLVVRARSRGSFIGEVTSRRVVIEADIPTNAFLEQQCGVDGSIRRVRAVVQLEPFQSGTAVTEDRFVVASTGNVCALTLSRDEIERIRASLRELKDQSEALQRQQTAARVTR